jgi:hypothetical protein
VFLNRHESRGSENLPVTLESHGSASKLHGRGHAPRNRWKDTVQIVYLRRSRLEPAAVELAIVMRARDGGYLHRRMRCIGNELSGALPYLANPDPDVLTQGGEPSTPRWVHDVHFETAEQALEAAQRQDPPARPDGWKTKSDFYEFFTEELEAKLLPEAEAAGELATVATWACAVAVSAAFLYAAWLALESWLMGLDDEDVIGNIVIVAVLILASAAGHTTYGLIISRIRARNLRKAMER